MRCAQKQMFGRDILILEVCRLAKRLLQDFVERIAHAWLRRGAGHSREFLLNTVQIALQPFNRNADLFEHRGNHTLAIFDKGQQQMDGLNLGIAEFGRPLLCLLHRLLRFDGQFVPTNSHDSTPATGHLILTCRSMYPIIRSKSLFQM